MTIPNSYFLYINIVIALIYVFVCIISIKNGLLLQLISLVYTFVCIIISWLISPIIASKIPLIKIDDMYNINNINIVINSFVYCLIIFIILKILFLFIAPLFKSVSKIPVIGFLNRVGGLVFGLVNGTIIVLLLSLLLNTPLIANGNEIKNNTVLKYGDFLSNKAVELTVKYINFDSLINTVENFDVEETRNSLSVWLVEQGFLNE